MNDAGRIGFVIKGNYSATETYDFLDVVYYNGSSYVAKKLTTGNTPQASDDYWQVMANANSTDISDETPTFTESATRTNINSGEKISTLFGKIKKWFTDLKAVAFSGSYNDLSDKPSIPAAVAVKGDSETNYRTGNVNITKANIGLGNVPNVATNDQTPTFTQATTRANLTSGEKLSISLGKISKFFADLKTVAFSGSYSDLSDKPTIPAAVAVKGNTESSYRTGNVNLTPANIGAVSTTGDTANNTVAFTSADSTTATAWTDVSALVTGEKHSSILNKVSTMFKNIRFLYKMLGTTDISAIGDGTVTNALSTLNSNLFTDLPGDTDGKNIFGQNYGLHVFSVITSVNAPKEAKEPYLVLTIRNAYFITQTWYSLYFDGDIYFRHCEIPRDWTWSTFRKITP